MYLFDSIQASFITSQAYQQVNEEFALKTLEALRQVHLQLLQEDNDELVPIIWIHDYQLMLAAAMIRQVI